LLLRRYILFVADSFHYARVNGLFTPPGRANPPKNVLYCANDGFGNGSGWSIWKRKDCGENATACESSSARIADLDVVHIHHHHIPNAKHCKVLNDFITQPQYFCPLISTRQSGQNGSAQAVQRSTASILAWFLHFITFNYLNVFCFGFSCST
jgi:hypothetical protein